MYIFKNSWFNCFAAIVSICILFFSHLVSTSSVVDINDLPQYSVKFIHNSINDFYSEEQPIVPMTIKGHRYMCRMPKTSSIEQENQKSKQKSTEEKIQDEKNLNITLAKLDEGCIYFAKGWWMYEYCHNRHVRQYHPEKEGEPKISFFLGFSTTELKRQEEHLATENQYKESLNKENPSKLNRIKSEQKRKVGTIDIESLKEIKDSEVEKLKNNDNEKKDFDTINGAYEYVSKEDGAVIPFVSFLFDHGTKCDMTGLQRKVEVRVFCGPPQPGQTGPAFVGIEEPTTCSYVAEIRMPQLCSHPYFDNGKDIINDILCFESLSDKPTS